MSLNGKLDPSDFRPAGPGPDDTPPTWHDSFGPHGVTGTDAVTPSRIGSQQKKHADPDEWFAQRFPAAFKEDPGRVFARNSNGSISRLNGEYVLANCLGPVGSPDRPIVFCTVSEQLYGYDPKEGIYCPMRPWALTARVVELLDECARACKKKVRRQVQSVKRPRNLRDIPDAIRSVTARELFPSKADGRTRIHVQNGILDLERLALHPFTPDEPARWKVRARWDEDAPEPSRFLRFLDQLFPDPADRRLALETAGMILLGNPWEKILLLMGSGGEGKTTFVRILQELLGDQAAGEVHLSTAKSRFTSQHWEKLLLYEDEVTIEDLQDNAAILKKISSDSKIFAERKYQNRRRPIICHALPILISNQRLRVSLDGDRRAWLRRLLVLEAAPASRTRRVIPRLHRVLIEKEGTGILKLIAGAAHEMLSRNGPTPLTPPQEARVEIVLQGEPMKSFVAAHIRQLEGGHVYRQELKARIARWLEAHGLAVPSSDTAFGRRLNPLMESAGGTPGRSLSEHRDYGTTGWRGVTLV